MSPVLFPWQHTHINPFSQLFLEGWSHFCQYLPLTQMCVCNFITGFSLLQDWLVFLSVCVLGLHTWLSAFVVDVSDDKHHSVVVDEAYNDSEWCKHFNLKSEAIHMSRICVCILFVDHCKVNTTIYEWKSLITMHKCTSFSVSILTQFASPRY